ncbi:uncharacterized protein DFL_005060 [Arthrobotrys flagrans]|uniref:Uncharacterized protein n=2 Tax=Arthrobotrys flagrans TaxID=97331 RepID=A0A437A6I5_ARTFL|nr:hypothetical protein DFL_005060 [Arthrobotrys flagrans]
MFAPSYNFHVEPSTWQAPHGQADQDTTRLPGWRYGSTTPPEAPSSWYSLIIPESAKRIILGSTEQIERVEETQPKDDEPDEPIEKEETPIWRYGSTTPPEKWYDRFIPKSIRRRQQLSKKLEANESKEKAEIERKNFLKKEYGDVDCGHCAVSNEWIECGACMEVPPAEPPPVKSPVKEEPPPKPCWEVRPDPSEPETRSCWVKQYNPRLQRYEYVAKPWRPPPEEGEEDEIREDSHEILERDRMYGYGNRPSESSTPRRTKEAVENPFSCGRKPPWLQHVRKFVRAEELDSPPPPASQFVSKTGTLLGKFSEGYFRVPYYDPEYRRFRYAEPRTIDMNNLKLRFRSTAPPPKPVAPRRPRMLPKRPLVMAQRKEPVKIRVPEYDSGPRYTPPPVRVPVRPRPKPTPKPRTENPYHSPRVVMFPPSPRDPLDDTPCPLPRKPKPKIKVKFKDDDGEYQPGEGEEPEEWETESPSHPHVPTALPGKTIKRRRRRMNSDPTYKQHGVRENNRIEKQDLQQMKDEEVVGNGDGQSKEEISVSHLVKPKPVFEPKPILKNGNKKDVEPASSRNEWQNEEATPSKPSKPKEPKWEQLQTASSHLNKQARKEKRDEDGEYIPVQNREEERREQLDMKNQVDKEAEKEVEDESESEQNENKGESSKPEKVQKKIRRRRKAPEDCAYRPSHRVWPWVEIDRSHT